MSSGVDKVAGGLLLPESAMDVPTEDGVALRAKAGAIEMAIKGGIWLPAFIRSAAKVPLLGDADATLDPAADKCSLYIIPPNTLTAPRVYTWANAGQETTHVVTIVRLDLSAHDATFRNSTPTVLYNGTNNLTKPKQFQIYFTAGAWVANTLSWAQLF